MSAKPGLAGAVGGTCVMMLAMARDMDWEMVLPERPYGFAMRFKKSDPREFYGMSEERARLLEERRHWLEQHGERHFGWSEAATGLAEEVLELSDTWLGSGEVQGREAGGDLRSRLWQLGGFFEPDFLLLDRELKLRAGCVCFPSSWDLGEKMNQRVMQIHDVVPGLNPALGKQIDLFLSRLKPGVSWERANWGLSRSAELNQHPERNLRRLDAGAELEEVWFRVEEQSLVALPESGGVLFGIRLNIRPLSELVAQRELAARLRLALETMPEEVARYKNLEMARGRLVEMLS